MQVQQNVSGVLHGFARGWRPGGCHGSNVQRLRSSVYISHLVMTGTGKQYAIQVYIYS